FPWDIGSRRTEQDPAKRIVGGSVDRAWRRVASRRVEFRCLAEASAYTSSVTTFTGTIPGSPFPVYSRLENSKSSNKVTHSRCIVGSRSRPRSVDKSLFLPYPYPTTNNESFIYESRASKTLPFPIDMDIYSGNHSRNNQFLKLLVKAISRIVSAIPRGIQYSLVNYRSGCSDIMWQQMSIYRNVARYAKWTKKDDKKIVNLFSRNPGLTLRQGPAKLKRKGLDIPYETIRTYLKANNMNSTTLLLDLLYVSDICETSDTHCGASRFRGRLYCYGVSHASSFLPPLRLLSQQSVANRHAHSRQSGWSFLSFPSRLDTRRNNSRSVCHLNRVLSRLITLFSYYSDSYLASQDLHCTWR
ncbi:hypothetical protein ALC56_00124, partial [Trachymyrmex septentrionalis]